MKRIIASTALALMMSTAALADGHGMKTYQMERNGDVFASEFIGKRVYAAEKDYDGFTAETRVADGAEKEWDDIGEVNDVILGRDGMVKAVILGIGGFIGIGEKDVAVPMDQIKMVQEEGEEPGDTFLVVNANKESLTAAEGFKRAEVMEAEAKEEAAEAETEAAETTETAAATTEEVTEDATETAAAATEEVKEETAEATTETSETMTTEETETAATTETETAATTETETAETTETETVVATETEEPKTDETAATTTTTTTTATEATPRMDGERTMLRRSTIEREGYADAKMEELTTEDLTGARVYGSNDEDVGEIDKLLVNTDGKIERAVLDIGGFLGLGEHSIAVTMDELRILRSEDGDLRIYVDGTQEELEAQPEYEG